MSETPLQNQSAFRREIRPMLRLAAPVVASELAWMAMGVVDTLMVGRVSAMALGAVGLGSSAFFGVAVFGIGLSMGLDHLVGKAFGRGDREDALACLIQGLYIALIASLPLMAILYALPSALGFAGVEEAVVDATRPYLNILILSLPPLLIYNALRRYLQAIDVAKAVAVILISANVFNFGVDWALIFGKFGLPALGVEGAAWATVSSRSLMALGLGWLVWRDVKRNGITLAKGIFAPQWARLKALLTLGAPASVQMGFEVGGFTMATFLAGGLDANSLAGHQIALTVASFTFMVPLGLSSAGAVRVSQGLGRGDGEGAIGAGWVAIALGLVAMAISATTLAVFREELVRLFTPIPELLPIGASLLLLAAVFQLFDAVQVVTTGTLRGLGDTRSPMYANLVGHWLLGLPIGYYLAFHGGYGVRGLWMGLCIGLAVVAVGLLRVWTTKAKAYRSPSTP